MLSLIYNRWYISLSLLFRFEGNSYYEDLTMAVLPRLDDLISLHWSFGKAGDTSLLAFRCWTAFHPSFFSPCRSRGIPLSLFGGDAPGCFLVPLLAFSSRSFFLLLLPLEQLFRGVVWIISVLLLRCDISGSSSRPAWCRPSRENGKFCGLLGLGVFSRPLLEEVVACVPLVEAGSSQVSPVTLVVPFGVGPLELALLNILRVAEGFLSSLTAWVSRSTEPGM